jgi:uncharacterized protein (TIGR02118 family)
VIKLTLLYGHPKDPAAFEQYYAGTHLPIAAKIQGAERAEFSKVIGTPDGSTPAFYRIAEFWFGSLDQMQSVMASPEAKSAVADLPNFATGGVTVLISEGA